MDLSKLVPTKEEREEYLKVYDASGAAETAYDDAVEALPDNDEFEDKQTAINRECRDKKITISEAYDQQKAIEKVEQERIDAIPEIAALKAARAVAAEAYSNHKIESGVDYNYDTDQPYRCALSGAVMLDDDEYLIDESTDERVLRCLILPSRAEFEEAKNVDVQEDAPVAATG